MICSPANAVSSKFKAHSRYESLYHKPLSSFVSDILDVALSHDVPLPDLPGASDHNLCFAK